MHLRGDLPLGGQRRRFPTIGLMVFLPFWLFDWAHQQTKIFDFLRVLVVEEEPAGEDEASYKSCCFSCGHGYADGNLFLPAGELIGNIS